MSKEVEFLTESFLNNVLNKVKEEIEETINTIAEESLKQCPKDTGALRDSIEKEVNTEGLSVNAEISYNTEYALKQHEISANNYTTAGTKSKYLEDPFIENTVDILKRIEEVINNG